LLQRCSRPLCRSQTTNPPTTTTLASHEDRAEGGHKQPTNRLIPQGPTVCQTTRVTPPPPRSTPTRQNRTGSTSTGGTTTKVLHRRFH
jgi:hypothetical protein